MYENNYYILPSDHSWSIINNDIRVCTKCHLQISWMYVIRMYGEYCWVWKFGSDKPDLWRADNIPLSCTERVMNEALK